MTSQLGQAGNSLATATPGQNIHVNAVNPINSAAAAAVAAQNQNQVNAMVTYKLAAKFQSFLTFSKFNIDMHFVCLFVSYYLDLKTPAKRHDT